MVNGFATTDKIAEAQSRVSKVKEERFLDLQTSDTFLGHNAAEEN